MGRQQQDAKPAVAVSIRSMRLQDLAEVMAIERVSFPTPWTEQAFRSELTTNHYADYIIAEADDAVAGYAGMWIILDEAHVTCIAVHPDYRRRAVGKRLMGALMERAARRGCRRMTLEVRPSNLAARRLYLGFGFQPRGVRRGYYADTNEDAIVMWKYGLAQHSVEGS